MIVAESLWHRFGHRTALRDVSLKVSPGEIYGFVGPNGAGKTTTLRALATLVAPEQGRVEICGHDVVRSPFTVRRLVGFVPDETGVYQRLTVREYVDFFACAAGLEALDTRQRAVDIALELTGMADLASRWCSDLSKGVRQRLALARALVHDPPVLLLDEPASGLDPRARIELFELLRLLKEQDKTIVLSSHILSELVGVVSHLGIIEKGRMVVSGPARQISEMLGQDRNVLVRLLEPVRNRGEVLRRVEGVVEVVEREPKLLAVTIRGDEQVVAAVVRGAVEAGLPVVGVESEWNDLERLFLVATQGALQ